MGTLRHLTPAQLADLADRERAGRIDKTAMTNEERLEWGLMDRHQAAEHEHLAAFPPSRERAERSRGPSPDDIWAEGESA